MIQWRKCRPLAQLTNTQNIFYYRHFSITSIFEALLIHLWHRNHQNFVVYKIFLFTKFCFDFFFNSWKFVIRNSWIHEVNSSFVTYLDWYLSCLAIQTPGGLRMEPWKLHLKQFEEISIFPERTVWRSPCECGHKFEQLSGGKQIWYLIKCIHQLLD